MKLCTPKNELMHEIKSLPIFFTKFMDLLNSKSPSPLEVTSYIPIKRIMTPYEKYLVFT